MMSIRREGYDINKWVANESKRRARSPKLLWVLIAGAALALAAPVIELLDTEDERGLVSILIFIPLLIALSRSPFARDSWATRRGVGSYDEFERDALAHATRRAYAVLLGVASALMGWLWIAPDLGWPAPQTQQDWSAFGFAFLFVGGALPVIFAEWMVPFPPEGDEMEE